MIDKIIHSDDFGLNKEATDAILDALEKGRINSTSLLFGCKQTDYAINKIAEVDKGYLAVHLNILEGKTTQSGFLSKLVDSNGFFKMSLGEIFFRLTFLNDENLKNDIYKEFSSQIDLFMNKFPNRELRLDSHLHTHTIPALNDVMIKIFENYPVKYVRVPFEFKHKGLKGLAYKKQLRRLVLNSWSKRLRSIVSRYNISTNSFFIGSAASTELSIDYILKAFCSIDKNQLKGSPVEIMLHITKPEDLNNYDSWYVNNYRKAHYSTGRVLEYNMVLSEEFSKVINF